MDELEKVIANLGYPVGMGMAPSPADLARMKNAIIGDKYREGYDNALAEQPFDRAAVIEECARVAERKEFWDYLKPQAHIAAAIRALKDKP